MLCSMAGSVYDVLGYVHPAITAPHDGMMFSTVWNYHGLFWWYSCASHLGGGWWFSHCSLWCPTTVNPVWFSLPDATYYSMENARMMVKLQ